jgi:hypothetical protein
MLNTRNFCGFASTAGLTTLCLFSHLCVVQVIVIQFVNVCLPPLFFFQRVHFDLFLSLGFLSYCSKDEIGIPMLCAVLSFSDKAWLKSFTGNALGF